MKCVDCNGTGTVKGYTFTDGSGVTPHVCDTCKGKGQFGEPPRVDINATGRKALDLGPSWIWSAAKWEAKNLRIELRQYKNGCWGVMMVEAVVAPDNFVWEGT